MRARAAHHVGVVVPMFNSGATVARALESLRAQTHARWSAVVVDDGSSDAGPDIVRWIASGDERITLIRQARGGVARARNRGMDELDAMRVQSVGWLDADDVYTPIALRAMVGTIERSGLGASVGDFEFMSAAGRVLARHDQRFEQVGWDEMLGSVFMLVSSQLVRREALGGLRFREDLDLVEDTDLWLRLAERGVRWQRVPEVVTRYTIHPGARSMDFEGMMRATRAVFEAAFQRAAARDPAHAPSSTRVDASAARLRAVLARAALHYATRAALSGSDAPAALARAEALMRTHLPEGQVLDRSALQRAGERAAIMTLGLAPASDGARDVGSPERVNAWLQRCEARGWIIRGEEEPAVRRAAA